MILNEKTCIFRRHQFLTECLPVKRRETVCILCDESIPFLCFELLQESRVVDPRQLIQFCRNTVYFTILDQTVYQQLMTNALEEISM